MAGERENRCKKCRHLNTKLFLKGERCYTDKCALEGKKSGVFVRRRRLSQYGRQLREKQKIRYMYGVRENLFRKYYRMAAKSSRPTPEEFLRLLERRLDNVVYKLGFSLSRSQARQLVNHAHFLVNGRRASVPSHLLKENDVVEVKKKSKKLPFVKQILSGSEGRPVPEWLEVDKKSFKGLVKKLPQREDLIQEIDLALIVEYYSR
ncbi:30S ribosomal protein S4 [Candidatus Aerophobetes bacterium]|uniref:Small ribosomal subunit protein uS4 n=1 Tax=Aerophobetes bacterium TaxID=2030807 RepID=A0A523QMQ6_UNCAE|nr:MAG: 30S ribosomal protein S4 [Candidatus Aerophobetes bacterium]